MSDAAEVRDWLDSVPRGYGERKNSYLTLPGALALAYAALDSADAPDTVHEARLQNDGYGVEYVIRFKVTDVEITRPCPDGHDWTEWQYDMMGGDIRHCRRCETREFT